MARDGIFSMIGCVVHDRKISTSGVSDEPTVGISPRYIKVKLKKMGGGGWEGKVQVDAFRLLYVSTWPMFCGPEYGQTGMFQTQISGPYRGLNVNNGVELFSGPWNGS